EKNNRPCVYNGAIAILITSELDTDKKRTSQLSSRSCCIFFCLLVAVSHQSRKHEFPWHTNLVGSSPFRSLSTVYFAADRDYRAHDIPDDSALFCRRNKHELISRSCFRVFSRRYYCFLQPFGHSHCCGRRSEICRTDTISYDILVFPGA